MTDINALDASQIGFSDNVMFYLASTHTDIYDFKKKEDASFDKMNVEFSDDVIGVVNIAEQEFININDVDFNREYISIGFNNNDLVELPFSGNSFTFIDRSYIEATTADIYDYVLLQGLDYQEIAANSISYSSPPTIIIAKNETPDEPTAYFENSESEVISDSTPGSPINSQPNNSPGEYSPNEEIIYSPSNPPPTNDTSYPTTFVPNSAPKLLNPIDDQYTFEDSLFSFKMPSNMFFDGDFGDSLTYKATQVGSTKLPSWLTFDTAKNLFIGTPTNDHVGAYEIRLTATDSHNASIYDEFIITVVNTNDTPTTEIAFVSQIAIEDAPFNFTFDNTVFNDVDVGDVLSYSATLTDGSPLPSWLTFDALNRSFSGTPANPDVGILNIRVTATDLKGEFTTNDFSLEVKNTNDAPTAVIDNDVTDEDTTFTTINVLTNDTDPDLGDSQSVVGFDTTLTLGIVINNGDGTFNYNPNNVFEYLDFGDVATDSFTYTMSDGQGVQSTATVTIVINGINDAPIANADFDTTDEDSAFTTINVLNNDTDLDADDTQTIVNLDNTATQGIVINNGDGTFDYDPNNAFEYLDFGDVATDSFTYTMQDSQGVQSTATMTITIVGVNDAPVAFDDTDTTDEDSAFTTINVLNNDTDLDADDTQTIVSINTAGTLGLVTNNGDGTFDYDPNNVFEYLDFSDVATDSFTYTMQDSQGVQSTATMTITIVGVNDAPNAVNDGDTTN